MTRILIVDDKEENVYYLQSLLTGNGYQVDSVRHGAEALVKARQALPDLIISDLLMPVMDGYTLLRLCKSDPRLKLIPFIVYTATYTEPEDERLALSLGADAFILKPAEPEDFLARIREVQNNVAAGTRTPAKFPTGNEKELLKVYSETLIRKLEEKTLQLEEANRTLQQDITNRKRVEENLRLLNSAVVQTREAILITDAELDLPGPRIVFVNPAFTRMTGYTADELTGQTPRILQGPRTDRAVLRRLRKNLEQGETFEGEAIQYRKDGTEYYQEWQVTPLRNDEGKVTHYVAIQRDITNQRKLEMQLRQSQKMDAFGQLAGGVAHDFNNILAVIQMQAGLLKAEPGLPPEQLEAFDEIENAARRGANLTRQLLLFSRQQTMQPRSFNLHDSISGMTKMLQRTLGEQYQVQFNFSGEKLWLHADPGMIDQILLNLTVNARDAMPKGGKIFIETSAVEFDEISAQQTTKARPGAFACLCVTDTGHGIPPEILPQIFEPFFTTKEVGKGTGLGLATVFGIVQQHKGWINVYSEVGRGSTFRIYLPRLNEDSDTNFISAPPSAVRGGSETILLVEDEPTLRLSVRTILSRLGYRVLEAANGREALTVWNQHKADIRLLLTDMVMPGGLSGKDLADQILALDPKLKVIFSSGYSAETMAQDFKLDEGVNFLTKPYEAGKLARTVRKNLDQAA